MAILNRSSNSQQDMSDQQAVERYRYLLKTAPPDTIEQAHEEAFSRLTPEQRQLVLQQLSGVSTPAEQPQTSEDPGALARLATRAEIRQPGILERLFGSTPNGSSGFGSGAARGGGMGLGGMIAGSLLGSVAGTVLGSAIAHSFLDEHPSPEGVADTNAESEAHADEDLNAFEQGDGDTSGLGDGFDDFGGGFEDV
jgi:hypothetical protein